LLLFGSVEQNTLLLHSFFHFALRLKISVHSRLAFLLEIVFAPLLRGHSVDSSLELSGFLLFLLELLGALGQKERDIAQAFRY